MKRFFLVTCSFAAFALFLNSEVFATVFKASRRLSGFSPDSRHYIYLESSRNSVTEVPTAQLQIIDVTTNSCVRNGCLKTEYDRSSSSLSNQAAEYDLLKRTLDLRRMLRLTQLKVGLPLSVVSRSSKPDGTETVQVRLNNRSQPLQIRLQQKYLSSVLPGGYSQVERASMRLAITYNNRQLTLGDLNNYREAVKKYSIREVRLSPNGRNAVVLINMTQPTYEGVLQTTFVQGFPLEISRTN
jgi:predicted secreted protein